MKMKNQSTIHGFFKRKHASSSSQDPEDTINLNNTPASSVPVTEDPSKKARIENNDIDLSTLERDPVCIAKFMITLLINKIQSDELK